LRLAGIWGCSEISFFEGMRLSRYIWACVHIRCCGNGFLWFRSYSGSLWQTPQSNQRSWAPAYGPSLGLGVPSFRDSSGGIAYGLLRCTSSRCMRLRRTVAALPPPDESLHSAFRRGQKIKSFTRANAHRVEWWKAESGKRKATVDCLIVPTLRVGMQPGTLRVPFSNV